MVQDNENDAEDKVFDISSKKNSDKKSDTDSRTFSNTKNGKASLIIKNSAFSQVTDIVKSFQSATKIYDDAFAGSAKIVKARLQDLGLTSQRSLRLQT